MTPNEAVAKIAETYADAEEAAQRLATRFKNCDDAWEALRDGGVIGGLEMQMRHRRLVALTTALQAELYAYHVDDTRRAQELGVDLPAPRSGGGR